MSIELSYIIATYNRLSFLKITLGKLLDELQPGEEIVVVDGDSTDGSKEYLQQLFDSGKIHQFISETDKNQAHAWNKAMLMANGTIIKKIIDDDVFCYEAIRKCKDYMLQNQAVDVIISNDLSSSLNNYKHVEQHSRLAQFEKWKQGIAPSFTFRDAHLLIRKRALAYIGLYNTGFVMMDWEYSLRISYLKSNIAYYTGYNALTVAHPQTVTSLQNHKLIEEQGKRGSIFYEYAGDRSDITLWSKLKISMGKLVYPAKKANDEQPPVEDITGIFNFYYDYLSELNRDGTFSILNKI